MGLSGPSQTVDLTEHLAVSGGRRAAVFTPNSLPGLQFWVAADTSAKWQDSGRSTPAVLDTDPVGAWDDMSGFTRHVLQATTTKRPLLKLAIQNSKPVMRFDGVDDHLFSAAFLAALPQPTTHFVVVKLAVVKSTNLTDGSGTVRQSLLCNATKYAMYAGGPTQTDPGTAVDTSFHVVTGVFNLLASALWVDGGVRLAGVNCGNTGMARATLGIDAGLVANPLQGDLAEVLIYGSALNTSNRQSVERYLGAKYGVTVA